MNTALKITLPTLAGMAYLAAIMVLGVTGHLSPPDTFTAIQSLIGLTGATGIYILASNYPNVNAIPHLIMGFAVVAAILILATDNTFSTNQSLALLALIFTGTAGAAVGVVAGGNPPPPGSTQSIG